MQKMTKERGGLFSALLGPQSTVGDPALLPALLSTPILSLSTEMSSCPHKLLEKLKII